MGIGLDVISALRAEGHEAIHLAEINGQRMEDDAILSLAASQDRIVLAHDLDMSRLMALAGATSPSVISFRLSNMSPLSVLHHLRHAISSFESDLLKGAIIAVTDAGARCHLLPILRPRDERA